MTAQAAASISIILSVLALCVSLVSATYLYFAINHWDDHVYVEANISQTGKWLRTRCTGTLAEACSHIVPIEKPANYERYRIVE